MSCTSPETTILPETDTLEAFDLDIPCDTQIVDGVHEPCPNPARWVLRRACCGGPPGLICDTCKDEIMASEDGWVCMVCDTIHIPARRLAASLDPIRSAT